MENTGLPSQPHTLQHSDPEDGPEGLKASRGRGRTPNGCIIGQQHRGHEQRSRASVDPLP